MFRYALLLAAPVVAGVLIAVAVILINGLRERRERSRTALREVGLPDREPASGRPAPDAKDQRIASYAFTQELPRKLIPTRTKEPRSR